MTVARPLNYYGSKENMCPQIHALIPTGVTTWVDVFCGSAIVTLKKFRHPKEVINDLNDDVINLYKILRDGEAEKLLSAIELTPFAQAELVAVYDAPPTDDPIEKARRFIVKSWFGRGGDRHRTGFRWSKSQTVAPEISWARLPDRLTAVAQRLRGVCIRKDDAFKIIDDYDAEDCLLFVDPPYPGAPGRRYRHHMDESEHKRLAERLGQCRAKVILTMSTDSIYKIALSGWHRHTSRVVTNGGKIKPERIYTNFVENFLFKELENTKHMEGVGR